MDVQCLRCKGNGRCGRSYCPHVLKSNAMFKVEKSIGRSDFETVSPAPFIGRHGYPYVNAGILTTPDRVDDAWRYDAPRHWAGVKMQIPDIVELRSSLLNSRFRANIKKQNKMLQISQEIGIAQKPVDVEIKLEDRPKFRMNADSVTAPMGPNAVLKKAEITSNPKVHKKVERVISDTDLKSVEALNYLYENNFDENFLTKILSVGSIGIGKNRKLVPTRWSITAVDDTLGKSLHAKIIDYPSIDENLAYFGSYLGNYYLVLMLPQIWSYELFETYMPKASWNTQDKINYSTDYEPYAGRKNYALECAGGYYSARLAVLEQLKKMKRQAGCLVIRVITGEYSVPLGVWVTREASRNAFRERPLRFGSMELMLKYAGAYLKKKFGFDASLIMDKSVMLKNIRTQRKLSNYF